MRWEKEISHFSGYAGEVVRGFIAPPVWLAMIPIFVGYMGIMFISWVAFEMAPGDPAGILVVTLSYLFAGFIVGRFAIGAAQGDVNSGFLSTEVAHVDAILFALRAAVLLLIWEVPLFLLIEGMGSGPTIDPSNLVNASFMVYVSFIVTMLVFLGPTITWLLAACTSSFGEIFTKDPWLWLFQVRRKDLPIFYGALIGGWICFLVIYAIPSAIFATAIAQLMMPSESNPDPFAAMQAMMMIPFLFFLIPAAAAPVILGRLIGAFVQGSPAFSGGVGDLSPSFLLNDDDDIATPDISYDAEVGFAAEDNPSPVLIDWAKQICVSHAAVQSAYIILYQGEQDAEPSPRIVIEIDLEAKFSDQQAVKKALHEGRPPADLLFMNHQNRSEIQKLGILVYRKR